MDVKRSASYPKKSRPQCSYCGLFGHVKDKCYTPNGYPPGYQFKNQKTDTSVKA